ncbi:MAG: hypothetical protein NC235_07600 [Clostridiales bacterium]|nr:hypothetical protein [Clostridiales bacterium]MCM1576979.1 hypothetical protein [Bacteroides sp.]
MDYKKIVLSSLKPKVKAFGFDRNELESVAAQIANNLNLTEDASEEEVQTAIDSAVDVAIPFLKLTQSAVSRIVNAQRSKSNKEDEQSDPVAQPKSPTNGTEEVPAWAQKLIDSNNALQSEINAMKAEKATTSRKVRLKDAVKNAGAYGKSVLRQFGRMSFANDEEFENYLDEVKEDLRNFDQERIDAGLQDLGNPPSAQGGGTKTETEITDAELDQMAGMFN